MRVPLISGERQSIEQGSVSTSRLVVGGAAEIFNDMRDGHLQSCFGRYSDQTNVGFVVVSQKSIDQGFVHLLQHIKAAEDAALWLLPWLIQLNLQHQSLTELSVRVQEHVLGSKVARTVVSVQESAQAGRGILTGRALTHPVTAAHHVSPDLKVFILQVPC